MKTNVLMVTILISGLFAACRKSDAKGPKTQELYGLDGCSMEWDGTKVTLTKAGKKIARIEVRERVINNKPGWVVYAFDDYGEADTLYYEVNTKGALEAYRSVEVEGARVLVEYDSQGRIVKATRIMDKAPINLMEGQQFKVDK
jgi:hypothetical protein